MLEYRTFKAMNRALQEKRSYAILIDKFRAYHYLGSGHYPRLKIFSSLENKVSYRIAIDGAWEPQTTRCILHVFKHLNDEAVSLIFSYLERNNGKVRPF